MNPLHSIPLPNSTEWTLRYLDDALTEEERRQGALRLQYDPEFRRAAVETLIEITQLIELGHETRLLRTSATPSEPQPRRVADRLGHWWATLTLPFRLRPASRLTLVLAVLAALLCLATLIAQSLAPQFRLLQVQGQVWIEHQGHRTPTRSGSAVYDGAWIVLGPDAAATVAFRRESTLLHLTDGAALQLNAGSDGKQLVLRKGSLRASVARLPGFRPLTLRTDQMSVRITGTIFSISAKDDTTRIRVEKGDIQAASLHDGTVATVFAGQLASLKQGGSLEVRPLPGGVLNGP